MTTPHPTSVAGVTALFIWLGEHAEGIMRVTSWTIATISGALSIAYTVYRWRSERAKK